MILREWLDKRIEDAREDCLNQDIETYADGYAEGYKDALQLVLDILPKLEQEVTLRQLNEMCYNYKASNRCVYCPMHDSYYGCHFDKDPASWKLEDIESAEKELGKVHVEEKVASSSSMCVSPVEGLTVVSANQVEGGPVVRLLMNSKEGWFVVYKGDEQVSQKTKDEGRATRLYKKICDFQSYRAKGGENDDK